MVFSPEHLITQAALGISKGDNVQQASDNGPGDKQSANAELGSVIAFVVFMWLVAVLIVFVGSLSKWSLESSAQFGDSFGALNCLFTGTAAAGAYAAFKSQQREIRRLQVEQHRDAVIKRFHELLRHWRNAVADVQLHERQPGNTLRRVGVDAIMMVENEYLGDLYALRTSFHKTKYRLKPGQTVGHYLGPHRSINASVLPCGAITTPSLCLDTIRRTFDRLHEERVGGQLGHVFRIMRELLVTIANASINDHLDEVDAGNLARAFKVLLSDPELHIMVYWALSNRANKTCYDVIDKYYLLEGLVDKNSGDIAIRVPEIKWYTQTYRKWCARHPDKTIPGCVQALFYSSDGP